MVWDSAALQKRPLPDTMELVSMIERRAFLRTLTAATACGPLAHRAAAAPATPQRLAVVTTEWRYPSHAWHMAERFLAGYPLDGRWHHPALKVVSAYVDQRPDNDLSR